jgi:hypothetical protein
LDELSPDVPAFGEAMEEDEGGVRIGHKYEFCERVRRNESTTIVKR